jgi:predicted metalloprotease
MSTTPPWLQYPGHQHMLQPRRKSNTGALLATVIVAVLIGAVAVVAFVSASDRGTSVADTGYDPTYTQTYSSEEYPTTTYETSTTTTTTEETADDTPTETTPAGPQPVYALEDNPLFSGDVGTPAVTCNLARWETSPAGAAAFFQSAIPCLDAAWQPVLEYQGLPFFTPNIVFPEGTEWSSPCGAVSGAGGAVAAFYCSEDNTLYMPFAGLQTEMYGAHPGVYLAVLAHEYGHHVQTLSGVMDEYWNQRYNTGADTEPGLEMSRRFELQAQCFSGMFLASVYGRGSVDDNILTEARTSQDRGDHNAGVPRDHGTDDHAIAWWEQGAQMNRTYQCNTWLSPPADVA